MLYFLSSLLCLLSYSFTHIMMLHTKDCIIATGHHYGGHRGRGRDGTHRGYRGSAAGFSGSFQRKILSAMLAGSTGEKWVGLINFPRSWHFRIATKGKSWGRTKIPNMVCNSRSSDAEGWRRRLPGHILARRVSNRGNMQLLYAVSH